MKKSSASLGKNSLICMRKELPVDVVKKRSVCCGVLSEFFENFQVQDMLQPQDCCGGSRVRTKLF